MTAEFQEIDLEIPPELAGQRLDSALARLLPEHSRTRIKGWIESGAVTISRHACKPRHLVEAGFRVHVRMTVEAPQTQVLPEKIALRIVHEDKDILVIEKPAGLVVHPGAGNPAHTLQNALLGFDATLGKLRLAGGCPQPRSSDIAIAATRSAHHVAGVSGSLRGRHDRRGHY
jgi:23S rRNA pseudouridine1911/1915/1917 synthase